jgi:hypothetical protein
MTNHVLYLLALHVGYGVLRFLAFAFCGAMLTASVFLSYRFFKEGNPWAALGSGLYILVSLIALWGLFK